MARLVTYRTLLDTASRQTVRSSVDNGDLQRVHRGVYGTGPVLRDDGLRALFLRLPPEALLSHGSAAERYGFSRSTDGRIHVTVPAGVTRPLWKGVAVHEAVLGVSDPLVTGGVPCVPPHRCAVDLARTVRRPDALAVLDAALRTGWCTHTGLTHEVGRHGGLRGVRQVRELVRLADGRAECAQESHLRLVLIDARIPRPEPQIWVADASRTTRYRIDLGYRARRLGLEYDGRSHTGRDRLRADRTRMNWLATQGWTMRYFTDADLYRRPSSIVATVRAALD